MKDMFYNYENRLDVKEYPQPILCDDFPEIVDSAPDIEIIKDVKGNELGVRVNHLHAFSLFFSLRGIVEGSSITELVENSNILFEIVDLNHVTRVSKELSAEQVYLNSFEAIRVDVDTATAAELTRACYRMRLTLTWPDGFYRLFSEKDGVLMVR